MKSKIIKITTLLSILVISLFSCLFSNKVVAHSKSTLENNSPLGALEEEALKKSDTYFEFDAQKLVNSSTPKPVSSLGGGYHWGQRGNICISPAVHAEATQQQVTCILDVCEDGSVKVYTKGGTKTTTYKQNPQAVLRAYELAYYASHSLDANETGIPQSSLTGGTLSYKVLMRFYCLAYHFNKFAELGVPAIYNPQASGGYSSLQAYQDKAIQEIKQDIKSGGTQYTGRFIFLSGILPVNRNSGQNDMMFSAKKTTVKKLQIVKQSQNDSSKKLKGAKFNIYKITKTSSGKTKETLVQEGATTNKNGVFTLSKGIQVGEKYKIVETKAPTGYQLPKNNEKTITIKKGENKVVFKDEPYYQIIIRKISSVKNEKGQTIGINGAQFRIQLSDTEGGNNNGKYLYKKSDGTYGYTSATKDATDEKEKELYNASIFTTKTLKVDGKNKKGYIKISNLKNAYKFKVYEIKTPKGYQEPKSNVTVVAKKKIKDATEIEIKNTPSYGIRLRKIDEETKEPVEGAIFRFKNTNKKNENYGKWLTAKKDSKGNIKYGYTTDTSGENYNASLFKTNSKGYINIEDLKHLNTFRAYEEQAAPGYILNEELNKKGVEISTGDNKTVTVTNKREDVNGDGYFMKLIKIDEETSEPVGGAVFRFQNTNRNDPNYGTWLTATRDNEGNIKYGYTTDTSGENYNASLFVTDSQGCINIGKLEQPNTFRAYEEQAAPGYILNEELNKDGVEINTSNSKTVTVTNKKSEDEYIQGIEGVVFLDQVSKKTSKTNDLYDKNGETDEGINGVRVMLKKNGEIVSEVPSGKDSRGNNLDNGHYKFYGEDLEILTRELAQYTVEFEYNGIKYESIGDVYSTDGYNSFKQRHEEDDETQISKERYIESTSKAKEARDRREAEEKSLEIDRETFNESFSTLEGRTRIDEQGKSTNLATKYGQDGVIEYQHYYDEGAKLIGSRVNFEASDEAKSKGYSDEYYANDIYHIRSTTKNIIDLSQPGEPGGYPYDSTSNTIKYVNLGLNARALPDVAIASTLSSAEVSINGYSNIYEYNRRQKYLNDGSAYEVWVKQSDLSYSDYNQPIARDLYKSDVLYSQEQQAKGEANKVANVYLTYKIEIANNSSVTMDINELIDYYDENLEIISAGATTEKKDALNKGSGEQRLVIGNTFDTSSGKDYKDNGYNNRIIRTENMTVENGSKKEFYIQFKIKLSSLINLLENQNGIDVENVIEIGKTTASKDGKATPAIDIDSAVGNAIPTKKIETLEDDTDWAEAIKVKVADEARKIEGIVFEDSTASELKVGEERKGDGIYYESQETGIDNVKVSLVDIDTGEVARRYNNRNNEKIQQTSANGGKYTLDSFIPGNYIVVYTYGADAKYTAQQYKATIYGPEDKNIERTKYYTGANKDWYKTEKRNGEGRYSDAIDNYIYRNGNEGYPEGIPSYSDMRTFYGITAGTPYANTKTREEVEQIWVDNNDNLQHHTHATEVKQDIEIDAYTPYMGIGVEEPDFSASTSEDIQNGNVHKLCITDIDFGIVERPRYKVSVDEEINRIIVKKIDNSVIKDVKPGKEETPASVIYVANKDNSRGIVDMSIDTELLQGSQVAVEYSYKVRNDSEKEYNTYNYYQLGIEPEDVDKDKCIIKVSIENMANYVDNNLKFDTQSEMITDGDSNTNEINNWRQLDWKNEASKYIKQEERERLTGANDTCKYNTVLLGQKFSNANGVLLKPTQETQPVQLLLQTNLSSTQEQMRYNNCAEIVEVTKTWGREIDQEGDKALGNFDIVDIKEDFPTSKASKEPDTSYSEEIIIHPPTGNQYSNILYVIISICTLTVIVVVGKIFMKKTKK